MSMRAPSRATGAVAHRTARGYTLVEFMIGITLGLMAVAALTAVTSSVSANRKEFERTARQVENGRYAMQLLSDDIVNAGYFGEFDPRDVGVPALRPDPCSTALTDLAAVPMVHVQGYLPGSTFPSCVSDVRPGTAALLVRRLATCIAGDVNCAAANPGQIYFQSSLCNSELSNLTVGSHYVVALQPSSGAGPFTLTQHDCHTQAPLRAYVVHIYFVARNNEPGDGVPTLKRAELGAGGAFTVVPLVEGIENLQLEYGIDVNGDSIPDRVNADPGTLDGCVLDACYIANWVNVMSVNVHVLSRASEASAGYTDRKTYALGTNPDGTNLVVGPFNDQYKRHAYQQTIRFNNPAQRRQG